MENLIVIKRPDNVVHAIHRLNMTQEGISQTGTLTRSLDQSRDIGNLQIRRVFARWVPDLAQEVLSHITISYSLILYLNDQKGKDPAGLRSITWKLPTQKFEKGKNLRIWDQEQRSALHWARWCKMGNFLPQRSAPSSG